jgi:class 3 adenylate cyclase/tetratricopeptide (TPR) repeat protein
VRCAACGTELIAGKRFCHACGAKAVGDCPACGASVAADFRFCPDCGFALSAAEANAATPPPADDPLARMARTIPEGLAHKMRAANAAIAGERKQVTVLFCDLAGSTAIAERLDPEEYHDLLDEYLALAFREIYRLEGIVTYSAGDGLMALFGAPIAHEDAPQRAVRAALAIRDELAVLAARLRAERGLELRARIGIHTGPVVVGTVGSDLKMDYTAIGDTTNLASRLESVAVPGTILVSDATHRLVRGFFRVRSAGPFSVKGKSEPLVAYEVEGETTASSPMAIAAARGLTPLVGRSEELSQLGACFRRLGGGLAQVVGVVGDAGLGKSRLVYEFRRRLEAEPVTFFEGRCSALGQAVPYSPFLSMLKQYFGVLPGDDFDTVCAKFAERLGPDMHKVGEEYPALGPLLGFRTKHGRTAGPDDLKRETFDAVTRLVLGKSDGLPVVMVIEDLHWIDDASRELLESLVARLATANLMVLVTHRPDDRAIWRTRAALTQIVIPRLSDADVRTIVRAVAGGALPEQLERLLVDKAEGSPFCAEEITRALIEEGYLATNGGGARLTRPLDEIRIPGTVQEVIAARLDRLGAPAKRVVQIAAVLGRQFRRDQLATLLEGEGLDVAAALGELEQRGIIHRKSVLASDEYRFGESLTQEVAYESLLLKQRRQLHERIGALLESEPGEMTAERAALLAHHLGRSEDRRKAIAAQLRAADAAERLPSYGTAVAFFRRAAELADVEPSDDDTRRAAVEALAGLARLGVLFGCPPLAECARAARRGRELAEQLGDTEAEASLLYFDGVAMMLAGEFNDGLALAEQSIVVAQRHGHGITVLRLARGLAIYHAFDGRFELALREIDWAIEELVRGGHEPLSDLAVSGHWIRDNIRLLADDLDAALAGARETHALAVRAPNRTVTCGAAATMAQVHFLRGEYADALRWATEALALAERIGNVSAFPGSAAIVLASRAALGEREDPTHELELIDQAIAAGSTVQTTFRFVADGLLAVRDLARAERFVEAQQRNPIRSGRVRDAYIATSLGELLMHLGRLEEAEAAFTWAIALADLVGARSTLAAAATGAGELAAARGDHAASARHLGRALEIARAMRLGRYLPRIEALLGTSSSAVVGSR